MTGMNPRRERRGVARRTAGPRRGRTTVSSHQQYSPRRVRLGIAIHPALLRDSIRRLIDREPDLEVVGDARDEGQVVQMLSSETPELLLLDSQGFGAEADQIITRLRRKGPEVRILVMSTGSSNEDMKQMLRAGAWGLVAKDDFDTLLRAIRAVAGGEIWANRSATARAIEHLPPLPPLAERPESRLTNREHQVAEGVTRGLRNKEIARELDITERTVKSHLNSIFRKLGLEGRIALALFEHDRARPKS